jgi:hypothetical protein
MQIINVIPSRWAEVHKVDKVFEVKLFESDKYIESFYCHKKSKIKPHLRKLGYSLIKS